MLPKIKIYFFHWHVLIFHLLAFHSLVFSRTTAFPVIPQSDNLFFTRKKQQAYQSRFSLRLGVRLSVAFQQRNINRIFNHSHKSSPQYNDFLAFYSLFAFFIIFVSVLTTHKKVMQRREKEKQTRASTLSNSLMSELYTTKYQIAFLSNLLYCICTVYLSANNYLSFSRFMSPL
jgi:uncharacterized protein YpmS